TTNCPLWKSHRIPRALNGSVPPTRGGAAGRRRGSRPRGKGSRDERWIAWGTLLSKLPAPWVDRFNAAPLKETPRRVGTFPAGANYEWKHGVRNHERSAAAPAAGVVDGAASAAGAADVAGVRRIGPAWHGRG